MKPGWVARRKRINKIKEEIDAQMKGESMLDSIVEEKIPEKHLGDIQEVQGETTMVDDFNNSNGDPINA